GISNAGTLTLDRVVVTGNTTSSGITDNGAGIFSSGTLTVTNSAILNNRASTAGSGGGIYSNGNLTLTNCTIADNFAKFNAGVTLVADSGTTSTVTNCTITLNVAAFDTGGMAVLDGGANPGPVAIRNTLVIDNGTQFDGNPNFGHSNTNNPNTTLDHNY